MKIIFADFRLLPRLLWSAFVKQEKWSNIMRNIYHHYSWSDKVKAFNNSWNLFINNKMNETRRSWFILKITADHGKSAIEKMDCYCGERKNVSTYNSHLYYDDVLWGWSVLVLCSVDWELHQQVPNHCSSLRTRSRARENNISREETLMKVWFLVLV